MKFLNSLFLSFFLINLALPSPIFGEDGELESIDPDSVAKEKYEKIHKTLLEESGKARTQANSLLSDLNTKKANQSALETKRDSILNEASTKEALAASLKRSNDTHTAEIDKTQKQIDSNVTQSRKLKATAAGLEGSISENKKLLSDIQKEIGILQGVKAEFGTQLNTDTKALGEVNESLSELNKALPKIRQAIEKEQFELNTLNRELAEFKAREREYEREEKNNNNRKPQVNTEIKALDNRLKEIANQFDDLDIKKEEWKNKVVSEKKKQETAAEHARLFGEQFDRLAKQGAKLNSEMESNKKSIIQKSKALANIDVQKEELTDQVAILQSEVQSLVVDRDQVQKDLTAAKKRLNDAAEDDKADIQVEVDQLTKDLDAAKTELKAKQTESKKARATLLSLPAQKTKLRLDRAELVEQNRQKQETLDELTKKCADVAEQKTDQEEKRDAAKAMVVQLTKKAQQAEESFKQLEKERDKSIQILLGLKDESRSLTNRSRVLQRLLKVVNKATSTIEFEGIVSTTANLSRAQSRKIELLEEKDNLNTKANKLTGTVAFAKSKVNSATRNLKTAEQNESTLTDKISSQQKQRIASINEASQLLSANVELEQTIRNLNAEITKKSANIVALNQDADKLKLNAGKVDENVNAAIVLTKMAQELYSPQNTVASDLEKRAAQANTKLTQTKLAFSQRRTRVINFASEKGSLHGSKEATPLAQPAGAKAGSIVGTDLGKEEGETLKKKQDFDNAIATTQRLARLQTIENKEVESEKMRALRLKTQRYQQLFTRGEALGLQKGKVQGYDAGNSKLQEELGFEKGKSEGITQATAEAELSHRPKGRLEREAEILKSSPKNTIEKDAADSATEAAEVSWIESFTKKSSQIAKAIYSTIVPSVIAQNQEGVLKKEQVPGLKWTEKLNAFPKLEHPEITQAFQDAYLANYETGYYDTYIDLYKSAYDEEKGNARRAAHTAAIKLTYESEVKAGESEGKLLGSFEGYGYLDGFSTGFEEGRTKGESVAFERGRKSGKSAGYKNSIVAARATSLSNGRKDTDSEFANNAKVLFVKGSEVLLDDNADKKFEIDEKVSVSASIRNFGGVDAEKGSVKIRVKKNDVRGIKFDSLETALDDIEKDTRVNYTNLLTGTVISGSDIKFSAEVIQDNKVVGTIIVDEEIHAPYTILFRDYYDSKLGMKVNKVGDSSGIHNAVWISYKGEGPPQDGMSISMSTKDPAVTFTWGKEKGDPATLPKSNEWKRLPKAFENGWIRQAIFLKVRRQSALAGNEMRVRLKTKDGKIVYDKVVKAPIEVRK